jgi:hypothetical protein
MKGNSCVPKRMYPDPNQHLIRFSLHLQRIPMRMYVSPSHLHPSAVQAVFPQGMSPPIALQSRLPASSWLSYPDAPARPRSRRLAQYAASSLYHISSPDPVT